MRVYINNRDLLTWPKAMAEKLAVQGHEPVFVDNGSTYEPLLDYYSTTEFRVVLLGENVGHQSVWKCLTAELVRLKDDYVVTDPDLDISTVPDDWPSVLREGLEIRPTAFKCGLSLDDTRIPRVNPAWELDNFKDYPLGNHPAQWGSHLLLESPETSKCKYYAYPVDTTFALCRRGYIEAMNVGGIRAGRPYTARHLPWHLVVVEDPFDVYALQIPLNEELMYYYRNASRVSTTKGRMLNNLMRQYDERTRNATI